MKKDDILTYYDYLTKLAVAKCNSRTDAEDLVSDTFLAYFSYISSGKTIYHPKTWLTNTLYNKYNGLLRKKYRAPITLSIDDALGIANDQADDDYLSSDEAATVRRELSYLAEITREVMIRFYYGNQSHADISKALGIPEGTVKSRLHAGRSQMKKGFETMDTRENNLPGKLYLSYGGGGCVNGDPISLVENDLIAQNLLILAYEKPLNVSELSRSIGIPAAYIEPILSKLVNGELMVKTDGGKFYSDFLITTPKSAIANFKPQREFASKHFDRVWKTIDEMSKQITKLDWVKAMNKNEKLILDRYAILKALQDFQHLGSKKCSLPDFPMRRDGGRWFAQALAINAGYDEQEYREAQNYAFQGGHRSTWQASVGRAKNLSLFEFDTTLWDCPHRYGGAFDLYFTHIIPLLWHIYDGIPLENSNIPNDFIAFLPRLCEAGLIGYSNDKAYVSIPVIKRENYNELMVLIKNATSKITEEIGTEFSAFTETMKTKLPPHLTSVPELFRYHDATQYFAMSIVREAYDKELHLQGQDKVCPPVVLVYEE